VASLGAAADSFGLREFLGVGLEDASPDHSTISRTRRLIDLETHRAVFTWVLHVSEYGPAWGRVKRSALTGRNQQ
jgi:transposase-like protein DUF772